jgi:hypothetical protein
MSVALTGTNNLGLRYCIKGIAIPLDVSHQLDLLSSLPHGVSFPQR